MKIKIFILIVLLLSVQTVFSQMTDDSRKYLELMQTGRCGGDRHANRLV